MSYPYISGYHFSSSPSLPGAWSSAWSLPQQYREYEMGQKALEVAEIKDVGDDRESLSSCNSVDPDHLKPKDTEPPSNHTSRSKADPPGASLDSHHQESSDFQLLESQYTTSQDDCNTFPGEHSSTYSYPSFCSSHKLTPLTFESNLSLVRRASVSNSPMDSPNSTSSPGSFSSEPGDIDQETIHSCSFFREPTEIARPSFDNYTLLGNLDTFLDKKNLLEHIPTNSDTGRNYSSEFYPHPLLLSQPDGNNTWTLSLDPTISRPETILESSLELESLSLLSSCASDHNDEAIVRLRDTPSSVYSTPGYDGSCLSLPPLQAGDPGIAEINAGSDVSMIVSSTSSVQERHGKGTEISSTGNVDLYPNGLSHDSTVQYSSRDLQQPGRSKKLVKKSKDILGRLKRLFTPKRTIPEAHAAQPSKSVAAKNLSNPINSNAQPDTIPPASGPRFLLSPPSWPSYQRYKISRSTKSLTLSVGQSFSPENTSHSGSNIDEKYTYEYHARPKTLKEIKSQRRFSLPTAFIGTTSSRATSSMKHNITTPVSRSRSRPMSMYISS